MKERGRGMIRGEGREEKRARDDKEGGEKGEGKRTKEDKKGGERSEEGEG